VAESAAKRVSALWRYPVKSMLGEAMAALTVDARGVVGDRRFAVRTGAGKFGSGKTTRRFERVDGLLAFGAAYEDAALRVRFPDGRVVRGDAPEVHRALSAVLGQPVELVCEAAVSHMDAGPVHLVTEASLRWLSVRLPGAVVDARRLRPNLVLDVGGAGPVEDAWLGRDLLVGDEVRLRVVGRTERCIMVGLEQDGLPADPSILRGLAEANGACLGVYAAVVEPGTLRVGDTVRLL
jgi:uncharacterized protein YcbX